MQQQIPRPRLLGEIEEYLRVSPVTVLLGVRQVGKTTLARRVAEGRSDVMFFDLERAAGRSADGRARVQGGVFAEHLQAHLQHANQPVQAVPGVAAREQSGEALWNIGYCSKIVVYTNDPFYEQEHA